MNENKYSKIVNQKIYDSNVTLKNIDRDLFKIIETYYLSEKSIFNLSSPEMDEAKCIFKFPGVRRDGKNWFALSELSEEEILGLFELKMFW